MPTTKVITLYTAQELKELRPNAFKRAHQDYVRHLEHHGLDNNPDISKAHQNAMDILNDIYSFERDYDVSISGMSKVRRYALWHNHFVMVYRKEYFKGHFLRWQEEKRRFPHNQYHKGFTWRKYTKPWEVDECALTGTCFDLDYITILRDGVLDGASKHMVRRELAAQYENHNSEDWEYHTSEEYFLDGCVANERLFTENGVEHEA